MAEASEIEHMKLMRKINEDIAKINDPASHDWNVHQVRVRNDRFKTQFESLEHSQRLMIGGARDEAAREKLRRPFYEMEEKVMDARAVLEARILELEAKAAPPPPAVAPAQPIAQPKTPFLAQTVAHTRGKVEDLIIMHTLQDRLDKALRNKWSTERKDLDLPTIAMMLKILEDQASQNGSDDFSGAAMQIKVAKDHVSRMESSASNGARKQWPCVVCKSTSHTIEHCSKFMPLAYNDCSRIAAINRLCFLCLKRGHFVHECYSLKNRCQEPQCKSKSDVDHHRLLCPNQPARAESSVMFSGGRGRGIKRSGGSGRLTNSKRRKLSRSPEHHRSLAADRQQKHKINQSKSSKNRKKKGTGRKKNRNGRTASTEQLDLKKSPI